MGKGLLLKKVMVNSNSNKSELRREMKVRRKELAAVEKPQRMLVLCAGRRLGVHAKGFLRVFVCSAAFERFLV